ncbi:MAG: DUF1176 domain-containing protein [Phenylobacterium sp.]|uniref:DUF1176 domain-containing protein n=1 Tax=Phenylobacterium sp. TaxID=1871053 RepID=UPI00391D721E
MRAAILAWILATAAGAAQAADAGFKDWWVACDNVRDCAAFGFPGNYEEQGFLKLARGGTPDAPVVVEIAADAEGEALRVEVDGRAVAGLGALRPEGEGAYRRVRLTPAQSAGLAAAIANGSRLDILSGGRRVGGVSLSGSSAALRWMDDQQKRAGTSTALVAKGPRGPETVARLPALPVVAAAPAASQTGLPRAVPRAVKALAADCDEDIDKLEVDPIIARLSPGVVLYGPLCSRGAYNIIYSLFLADERGRGVRPLNLRYGSGEEAGSALMNVEFDPATQMLSNFDKARGVGDCGALSSWIWTGHAFEPVEQYLMGECRGVPMEDWPAVYRTRR